jgi:HPt (histidine-containing phosphotransfer) domain-containing protein
MNTFLVIAAVMAAIAAGAVALPLLRDRQSRIQGALMAVLVVGAAAGLGRIEAGPGGTTTITGIATSSRVDLDLARSKYGSKKADELCRMFVARAALDLQDLEKSSLARDADAVLAIAHGLAGVCATVFAHQMCATCREIMTAAGHPDWDHVQALADRLDIELNAVREHLQRRLS